MEIRQLETFVHVAQLQSFSRAAEVLGYTQSAITVQIRLLENELETRLFDRTGKRVVLTPSGKEFMGHASRILYDVNKAKKSMNDDAELKNPLHIGTIESLCTAKLPAVLSKFREFHPKVNMQVTIDTPEQLIRMMEHNGLDLIYILDTPRWDQNWVKVMEKAEPVVFVASADSEFAGKTLKMEDILEEIVGEISDEYDEDEKQFIRLADGSLIFEAKILLTDFFRVIDADPTEFGKLTEEVETLAGLLLEIKRDFPRRREIIEYDDYRFQVLEIDNRRILKVKFNRISDQGKERQEE